MELIFHLHLSSDRLVVVVNGGLSIALLPHSPSCRWRRREKDDCPSSLDLILSRPTDTTGFCRKGQVESGALHWCSYMYFSNSDESNSAC